jgi:hypothetical protein
MIATPLDRSNIIFQLYLDGKIFDWQSRYLLFKHKIICGSVCTGRSYRYIGSTGVYSATISRSMVSVGELPFNRIL